MKSLSLFFFAAAFSMAPLSSFAVEKGAPIQYMMKQVKALHKLPEVKLLAQSKKPVDVVNESNGETFQVTFPCTPTQISVALSDDDYEAVKQLLLVGNLSEHGCDDECFQEEEDEYRPFKEMAIGLIPQEIRLAFFHHPQGVMAFMTSPTRTSVTQYLNSLTQMLQFLEATKGEGDELTVTLTKEGDLSFITLRSFREDGDAMLLKIILTEKNWSCLLCSTDRYTPGLEKKAEQFFNSFRLN